MQESGCSPHAAVYSSVIDALWQTGIVWAQAKALQLFSYAVECVLLPCHVSRVCSIVASVNCNSCLQGQEALHC